jgi:hypothetical protein
MLDGRYRSAARVEMAQLHGRTLLPQAARQPRWTAPPPERHAERKSFMAPVPRSGKERRTSGDDAMRLRRSGSPTDRDALGPRM